MALRFIVPTLAVALSIPLSAPTFAQAGGTGGSIGKTDKSASGSEVDGHVQPSKRAAHRVAAKTEEPRASAGCDRIAGAWKWVFGLTANFKADGTATATNGEHSTWTCKGNMYVVEWSSGITDHSTLSSDGNTLSAVNSLGIHFSVTRF